MTQNQLAALAEMAQPRISAMERPGATKFNIETLVRLASAFKVGLKVEFVPFSAMLAWENNFSQDRFDAVRIDNDLPFLNPVIAIQAQPTIQLRYILNAAIPAASQGGMRSAHLREMMAPANITNATESVRQLTRYAPAGIPGSQSNEEISGELKRKTVGLRSRSRKLTKLARRKGTEGKLWRKLLKPQEPPTPPDSSSNLFSGEERTTNPYTQIMSSFSPASGI